MNTKATISVNRIIFFLISVSSLLIGEIFIANSHIYTYIICWIADFFFVLRIFDCKNIEGKLFNKYAIFIFAFYLYMFGNVLLFSLGIINIEDLRKNYNIEAINQCLLYATLSFYFFTLPVLLFKNSPPTISEKYYNLDYFTKKSVSIIGGILLLISMPIYWENVIDFVTTALTSGYAANYIDNNDSSAGISGNLMIFYVPMSVMLLVNCNRKLYKYLFLSLLIIPALSYMFVGGRGQAMSLLLCAIFLWLTEIIESRNKGKYLLIVVIIGFLLLGLFSTLREIRDYSLGSPAEIISIFLDNNLLEGIISTIKEMGSTIYIWLEVEHIVPTSFNWGYGYSYLASILACIPSNLVGYSFANDAALDVWLTEVSGANYGLGFSTFAETYYNFGYFGIILIFFVGLFVFWMLSGNISSWLDYKYRNAISAIALYIFVNTARNSLALSVRNICYGILIPMLLIYILRKILILKRGNRVEKKCDY